MTLELPSQPPQWHLGTTGLSFDDWVGPFYPPGTPSSKWLAFYARNFPCVELNTTFYALPPAERIRQWVETVGPDFRFSAKVVKSISHDAPLSQAIDPFRRFVEGLQPFGPQLEVLLLQFPPGLSIGQLPALERLLATLPNTPRLAVEFRCASWIHPETEALLARYGVAWVGLEHDDCPPMARVMATTDFLYVRLVGKHGRFETESHELFDPTPELTVWRDRIQAAITPQTRHVWVLFNNDFAGHGPATLRRFAALAGIELPAPPAVARQKRLF